MNFTHNLLKFLIFKKFKFLSSFKRIQIIFSKEFVLKYFSAKTM